jgi:hypothetical protein
MIAFAAEGGIDRNLRAISKKTVPVRQRRWSNQLHQTGPRSFEKHSAVVRGQIVLKATGTTRRSPFVYGFAGAATTSCVTLVPAASSRLSLTPDRVKTPPECDAITSSPGPE